MVSVKRVARHQAQVNYWIYASEDMAAVQADADEVILDNRRLLRENRALDTLLMICRKRREEVPDSAKQLQK
jgi:hypothetical protein